MKVPVAVAQIPVTWDLSENLKVITAALADTEPGEVVVLPEAAVSGYDDQLSGLADLDREAIANAAECLAELARDRRIHLFCGLLHYESGAWWNTARYLSPAGQSWTYRKVNLATHERGRLAAGRELPTLRVCLDGGPVTVGVELCREILFAEQWQYLAGAGAEIFIYLTYAANPAVPAGVWRSHLISHAAANQRFIVAANIADPRQHCPSMIVSPRGEVLGEVRRGEPGILRATIDTQDVSDWYLGQRRTDVVRLRYREPPATRNVAAGNGSASAETDADAHQDPDDQAGQAESGQPAAAAGAEVLADKSVLADKTVARKGDVLDGGRKADGAAARVDKVRPGEERQAQHGEQDGEAKEDIGDAIPRTRPSAAARRRRRARRRRARAGPSARPSPWRPAQGLLRPPSPPRPGSGRSPAPVPPPGASWNFPRRPDSPCWPCDTLRFS